MSLATTFQNTPSEVQKEIMTLGLRLTEAFGCARSETGVEAPSMTFKLHNI